MEIVLECVAALGMWPEISFCHLLMDVYTHLRFLQLDTGLEKELLTLFTYLSSHRDIVSALLLPREAEGKMIVSSHCDRVGYWHRYTVCQNSSI